MLGISLKQIFVFRISHFAFRISYFEIRISYFDLPAQGSSSKLCCIVVVDDAGGPLGIVTDRDLVSRVVAADNTVAVCRGRPRNQDAGIALHIGDLP